MMDPEPFVCAICGWPCDNTERCAACKDVELYLPDYMKSPKGQDFVRKHLPLLDDWKDGKPDDWDYERVLADNQVTVEWCDQMTSDDGKTFEKMPPEFCGWGFWWKHGCIHIGQCSETIARKAAALFVSLWLRGVSASFTDKLMDGFIMWLELQENKRLGFLAEIDKGDMTGWPYFRFTREGFCEHEPFDDMTCGWHLQQRIIDALDPQPDEEIIVTFTKRPKSGPARALDTADNVSEH